MEKYNSDFQYTENQTRPTEHVDGDGGSIQVRNIHQSRDAGEFEWMATHGVPGGSESGCRSDGRDEDPIQQTSGWGCGYSSCL